MHDRLSASDLISERDQEPGVRIFVLFVGDSD